MRVWLSHRAEMFIIAVAITALIVGIVLTLLRVWRPGSLLSAYAGTYFIIVVAAVLIGCVWSDRLVSKRYHGSVIAVCFCLIAGYGLALWYRALIAYRNYSPFIDLSYYESAVMQFSRLQLARIWDIGSPIWSQHFEPILFLLVPWYWIGLGGSALLVGAQAALAIIGAIPLYYIAKSRLDNHGALGYAVAAAYLLFGGLQSAFFYGFHPITLFPFFFLLAVMWYERSQFLWYSVFLVFSLLVKEEISFVIMAWGIWLLAGRKDKWWGGITITAGLLWYFLAFGVISYYHHGGYEYWGQFGSGSGGGALGILQFALFHPFQFFGQFTDTPNKIPMLIESFGSFGFLPLAAPASLIMLIPSLFLKLLSHDITSLDSFHYSAAMTPLLALTTIEGIRVILRRRRIPVQLAVYIVSVAVLANFYYGFAYHYRDYAMRFGVIRLSDFRVAQHSLMLDSVLQAIPPNAGVSCEYALCGHIKRLFGQKLPVPQNKALEYVVLDTTLPYVLTDVDTMKTYFDEKIYPYYDLVRTEDGIYLLKRIQ